jgi:hypothetical protein
LYGPCVANSCTGPAGFTSSTTINTQSPNGIANHCMNAAAILAGNISGTDPTTICVLSGCISAADLFGKSYACRCRRERSDRSFPRRGLLPTRVGGQSPLQLGSDPSAQINGDLHTGATTNRSQRIRAVASTIQRVLTGLKTDELTPRGLGE